MSKSKYGNSNLYMTTREFADLVVDALHEQNYFKYDDVMHPQDISYAFSTVAETIGSALGWAIKEEYEAEKKAKNSMPTYTSSVSVNDSEIDYSNWKLSRSSK
jgi:hypothetical protein